LYLVSETSAESDEGRRQVREENEEIWSRTTPIRERFEGGKRADAAQDEVTEI